MRGDVNKIHCNKCGKYLFTEIDTENGMKRTDDNRDYRYDEIADEFICDECNEGKNHKSCYGNYLDDEGNLCEEGTSGLCNYCVECRRDCVNV